MENLNKLANISKIKEDLFLSICNDIFTIFLNKKITLKTINEFEIFIKDKHFGLYALMSKCHHMAFYIGSPVSIPDFLNRIVKGKKKQRTENWMHHAKLIHSENLKTKYHFRWNYQGQDLTDNELNALKIYLNNNTEGEVFKIKNIILTSKLDKTGVLFPNEKTSKLLHNKFIVTIKSNNKTASFDYYCSNKDFTEGKVCLSKNDLKGAFECILSDAMAGNDTFENFCYEFGYDIDSRTHEKIYKSHVKTKEKIEKLSIDFYSLIDELNELV